MKPTKQSNFAEKLRQKGCGDLLFLGGVLILAAYGVLCVYSASSYNAEVQYGDAYYFLKKQIIGFVIGFAAMIGIGFLPYRKLNRRWVGLTALAVSLILLALVFVPGLGKSNYGATRWIGFGSFTIQPSEIAKYGFVLFTAWYFAKNPARMRSLKGVLPVLGAGLSICVLIMLEPNMSVTMCVGAIMVGMIFLAGASWKTVASICVPVLFAVPVLILAEPYRLQRLSAFVNPWASPKEEGYQLIQSLYALGNGNLFGVGIFNSRQKYRFLPFSESDFILSVIAEETGFVGVLALFAVIGFVIWRGFRIARRCDNFYGFMLVSGIMVAFAVQSALNALVVSGCIPPTGLPLPLISAGNTSLIVTMSGMGIVYGVSRHNGKEKRHKI
ncbi:MAG: putative lipid II flippase FtsW [Clostridia bacterium]|nr:putative lipid II flippase FtsW [Clostridia bacterium]